LAAAFFRGALFGRGLYGGGGVRLGIVPGAQHLEYGAPQIQLGSFLVSGQQRGAEFARSVTPVIAGSLDMCRINVEFVQREDLG
jgi:hypothetical protein